MSPLNRWIAEAINNGCFCRVDGWELPVNLNKQIDWEIGGMTYQDTRFITVYWPYEGRTPRVLKLHMNDFGKLEWSVTEKGDTGHVTQS